MLPELPDASLSIRAMGDVLYLGGRLPHLDEVSLHVGHSLVQDLLGVLGGAD